MPNFARRMKKPGAVCACVWILLLAAAMPAHSRPRGREAFSVRLDGYIGTKPESVPIEVKWTVSVKGDPYDLFVTKLRVLNGNIAYYDIINALEPYRTALTIVGDDEILDRFATAPAEQKISVIGFMEFAGGARYFMISSVDYVGSPPTAQKTPTAASGAP
jgi:hypothetical protein